MLQSLWENQHMFIISYWSVLHPPLMHDQCCVKAIQILIKWVQTRHTYAYCIYKHKVCILHKILRMHRHTWPCRQLYWAVASMKRSLCSSIVMGNFIWIEHLLKGHQSFSFSQRWHVYNLINYCILIHSF